MEGLAERGNAVFVIMNTYLYYTPRHFPKIALSVKYKRRGFPPGSYLFKAAIKKNIHFILDSLDRRRAGSLDFIHIHGDMHLKSAVLCKKLLKTPLFYASRNNDIERDRIIRKYGDLPLKQYLFSLLYERINLFRERQIAKHADMITFQSVLDMGDFIKRTGCDKEKIVIIPGNIGPPHFPGGWKGKNTAGKVDSLVYVGSFAANKGFVEMVKILAALKQRGWGNVKCHFLMREEEKERIQAVVHKYRVGDMAVFEGYQDPFPYLARASLFVYPALYDAFPDTVLEALYVNCPVIAASVGGIPDMLKHEELLFSRGDVNEAVSRLEKCLVEPGYYQKIRELCAERAPRFRFDWAKEFEDAMAGLLSKSSFRENGKEKN
jgi:glycosyltransferase involved in cell wall biosynthesis